MWDGNKWNEWQDLGGTLTSEPAAVSLEGRRVDIFVKGSDEQLLHKWMG